LTPSFEIVPARSLLATAPADLPALRFHQRAASGPTVRLLAVGDIGLSARVEQSAKRGGYAALFGELAPVLREGDLTFGNLEIPLVDHVGQGALFAASPAAAPALAESGFSLLNLANNHIRDHGPQGLQTTLRALANAGLQTLGAGADKNQTRNLTRTDRHGLRIGWLACARTLEDQGEAGPFFWEMDEPELLAAVRAARDGVDVLAVSIHAGFMYVDYPHPDLKAFAGQLAEAGADFVLIHHAHVLQGVEVLPQGSVVCYNLGNFLLDWQEGNVKGEVMVELQEQGAVFLLDLDRDGVCQAAALPTWMDEQPRVRWATGERGQAILERLRRISLDLQGDFAAAFHAQRSGRNTGLVLKVLLHHARRGNWRYVAGQLGKIRPKHALMLFRWLGDKLRRDG
jgi:poly-gamma-glutamate synthesis protein (capsule biosynthesis protein)